MMIEIDFGQVYNARINLALGYFDSVHLGHSALIDECKRRGDTAVFTFKNNLSSVLGRRDKQVFTYSERLAVIESKGVGAVVSAVADEAFLSLSGKEFLDTLIDTLNIERIVIGEDYTCGRDMLNARQVAEYCALRGVGTTVMPLVASEDGRKIASTRIGELLNTGEVREANRLLGFRYFVIGKVVGGRKAGKGSLGFPTANINIAEGKLTAKDGVYATNIVADGARYSGITNIGAHPTFGHYERNIESFIFDFDGDLYGKIIRVEFIERIRDIKQFDSVNELREQIERDIAFCYAIQTDGRTDD